MSFGNLHQYLAIGGLVELNENRENRRTARAGNPAHSLGRILELERHHPSRRVRDSFEKRIGRYQAPALTQGFTPRPAAQLFLPVVYDRLPARLGFHRRNLQVISRNRAIRHHHRRLVRRSHDPRRLYGDEKLEPLFGIQPLRDVAAVPNFVGRAHRLNC